MGGRWEGRGKKEREAGGKDGERRKERQVGWTGKEGKGGRWESKEERQVGKKEQREAGERGRWRRNISITGVTHGEAGWLAGGDGETKHLGRPSNVGKQG
ncbi:hypothetical protein Pcinc_028158, partial [Petrolisthes cinctipes]